MESNQPEIIEQLQTLPVVGARTEYNVTISPNGKTYALSGDHLNNTTITRDQIQLPAAPVKPDGYDDMEPTDGEKKRYDRRLSVWEDLQSGSTGDNPLMQSGAKIAAVATYVVEEVELVTDEIRVLQPHAKMPLGFAEGTLHTAEDDNNGGGKKKKKKKKKGGLSGIVTMNGETDGGIPNEFSITPGATVRGNPENGNTVVFHPRIMVKQTLESVEVVIK